jgi:hypothetical protein
MGGELSEQANGCIEEAAGSGYAIDKTPLERFGGFRPEAPD